MKARQKEGQRRVNRAAWKMLGYALAILFIVLVLCRAALAG